MNGVRKGSNLSGSERVDGPILKLEWIIRWGRRGCTEDSSLLTLILIEFIISLLIIL
jgi:hypothetical protein